MNQLKTAIPRDILSLIGDFLQSREHNIKMFNKVMEELKTLTIVGLMLKANFREEDVYFPYTDAGGLPIPSGLKAINYFSIASIQAHIQQLDLDYFNCCEMEYHLFKNIYVISDNHMETSYPCEKYPDTLIIRKNSFPDILEIDPRKRNLMLIEIEFYNHMNADQQYRFINLCRYANSHLNLTSCTIVETDDIDITCLRDYDLRYMQNKHEGIISPHFELDLQREQIRVEKTLSYRIKKAVDGCFRKYF